jgi:hypothetical protein
VFIFYYIAPNFKNFNSMKKIYLAFFAALFFLFSCDRQVQPFVLDAGTVVKILPDMSGWPITRADSDSIATPDTVYSPYLSPIEVVRQAVGISFQNYALFGNQAVDRGFHALQRDTISDPPCLMMYGTDIITQFGEYEPCFIEGEDCILFRAVNNVRDTIAYIPNNTMRTAESQIKIAYDAQDYEEVYRIFNEAFTFLPCTASEWRAIKAAEQD